MSRNIKSETVTITSGVYRGRSIATPGAGTHPMGSREKLALFNMISSYLPDAKVLDLFAGSGALGIEAVSRGASQVDFVEKNPRAVSVIQKNIDTLGVNGTVFTNDATRFSGEEYDVVLVDPPYDNFVLPDNLGLLVKKSGVLVLSHPFDAPEIDGLNLKKTSKYAAAHLSIYTK